MTDKGIILAGGMGTRLYPLTYSISKQLMPVYDKPMVFYPLGMLMLAGITKILIIVSPDQEYLFRQQLLDGRQWGVDIKYAVQNKPEGLAQAVTIGKNFVRHDTFAMILGDNIFYGEGLVRKMKDAGQRKEGATIFAYWVNNPEKYGVVEFAEDGRAVNLEEKPIHPKSNYAVTGMYFYDSKAVEYAEGLKPSSRGELEITDLNRIYMNDQKLRVELLGRGVAWLDTGSHSSLLEASNFVETIEKRQGLKICCPAEIAYNKGYIDGNQLLKYADTFNGNDYGKYLLNLCKGT